MDAHFRRAGHQLLIQLVAMSVKTLPPAPVPSLSSGFLAVLTASSLVETRCLGASGVSSSGSSSRTPFRRREAREVSSSLSRDGKDGTRFMFNRQVVYNLVAVPFSKVRLLASVWRLSEACHLKRLLPMMVSGRCIPYRFGLCRLNDATSGYACRKRTSLVSSLS